MADQESKPKRKATPAGVVGLLVIAGLATFIVLNLGGGGVDPARCQSVPTWLLTNIEDGLEVQGGGSIGNARAVKSQERDMYFIAAEIHGPGLEDTVGIWATNDLSAEQGVGLLYAVNGNADAFSVYPLGRRTDADIRTSDEGARASEQCLNL